MEGQYQNTSSRDRVGGMDWINMAQDRSKCWALVNMEPMGSIKCRVTEGQILASQVGHWSMKLVCHKFF
jgi:hypothetical protein